MSDIPRSYPNFDVVAGLPWSYSESYVSSTRSVATI
jgi:hypothetical protein